MQRTLVRYSTAMVAAFALFSGTSGQTLATQSRPVSGPAHELRAVKRSASGTIVYVSDFYHYTVTAFSSTGNEIAQVTQAQGIFGPQGLTTDASGNLYVAEGAGYVYGGGVAIYSPGLQSLVGSFSDTGTDSNSYMAGDVAVDNATGVVAIANLETTQTGPGSVVFYAKGASTACATVVDPNWYQIYFGAFDAKGNLYIDGRTVSGGTLVGVVSGECGATRITTLRGGTKIAYPGGIQVAANGDVLIADQGTDAGSIVYTFKPTKAGLGKPVATTQLGGSHDVAGIALAQNGTQLWDVDTNQYGSGPSGAGNGSVNQVAYPAGGSPIETFAPIGAQTLIGVAVSPGGSR